MDVTKGSTKTSLVPCHVWTHLFRIPLPPEETKGENDWNIDLDHVASGTGEWGCMEHLEDWKGVTVARRG